jgi:hypothetical protein
VYPTRRQSQVSEPFPAWALLLLLAPLFSGIFPGGGPQDLNAMYTLLSFYFGKRFDISDIVNWLHQLRLSDVSTSADIQVIGTGTLAEIRGIAQSILANNQDLGRGGQTWSGTCILIAVPGIHETIQPQDLAQARCIAEPFAWYGRYHSLDVVQNTP